MAEHTNSTSGMRVLMVDDTPANLSLLSDMLVSRGYKVLEARDGPTGLQIAEAEIPDIILLDIFMPGMDGYQVCQRLKASERTRDIPVIFISALNDVDNIVRAFDVGGVDYVTKPFKYKEVLARVANHLTLVRQRKEIEARRLQEQQTFAALNQMKDEFIRMATHDLRNPLNVILGYMVVLDRLEVAEHHKPLLLEARQAIQDSVGKMRDLVTNILDLAQMGAGMQLRPSAVQLKAFLEKCLVGHSVVASQKRIALTLEPLPEDIMVRLDTQYMTRAIDNLVANAIKYTPSGGRVAVRVRQIPNRVVIQVADTGMGIPAEELPHVFEAFYRVRSNQNPDVEGSGLGLSIVKAIVERHGGEIFATSEVGKGSVFSVALPLA